MSSTGDNWKTSSVGKTRKEKLREGIWWGYKYDSATLYNDLSQ